MKRFNKIMGTFVKTVLKLEKLEDKNINAKIAVDGQINELNRESIILKEEADMASITAGKIRDFYSVEK